MKRIKILRIFGAALVLSLLLTIIPVTPAFAAETLAINPTTAQVGAIISYSGSNYTASADEWYIDIYVSDQLTSVNNFIGIQVTRYKKVKFGSLLNANGTYSGTFTVPTTLNEGTLGISAPLTLAAGTTYYIYASGRYQYADPLIPNVQIKAIANLTIAANATLDTPSPASGPAGTSVVLTGSGFPASTALVIKFDTTTIMPTTGTTSLANGYILSSIIIPASATAGAHTISVTAGTTTANATFTVTASAALGALQPSSGPPGTFVAISGTNFPVSTAIVFKFDTTVLTPTGSALTGPAGSFASILTVPSSATAGSHVITVTVGSIEKTAIFTVTGTATATLNALTPTSGPGGTNVAVSGTSFPASTALVFKFDTITLTPSGSTQTGSDGSFSSVIVIPSDATAGGHTITVTAGSSSANATFTVTGGATTTPPTTTTIPIGIDQSDDTIGSTVSIGGSGFLPNSPVTVTLNGVAIKQGNSNESGFVVITFQIPPTSHGTHTITVTDGTNTATANFTVEATAPDTPQPFLPAMGEAVSLDTKFDWADVSDASAPVTYNFQIATSNNFSAESIIIDKIGLTASEYILTEAEQLKLSSEVTYYWREKAIDAALNESIWTGAGEFTITKPFEFTGWPLYLTIGLGGLILFLLGLWVGRRTAFYY